VLVPAFRAENAVGGYATKRAALPQSGIHVFAPTRGAPYASAGASPAAASQSRKKSVPKNVLKSPWERFLLRADVAANCAEAA
jgi:hypothetical protein